MYHLQCLLTFLLLWFLQPKYYGYFLSFHTFNNISFLLNMFTYIISAVHVTLCCIVIFCCSNYKIVGIINYRCYRLSFCLYYCHIQMRTHPTQLPTHTHTYTHTAQSMGIILINSENSLVRGLPYTSHLSSLLESGSTLIVWKWRCINDVNPCKISSGYGAAEMQGGAVKEKWSDETQTDRKIAWWTEREPQGLPFSLHEFPDVSISHLFSAFCGSCLLNTPSPVSMTGSNNSLENIYLAKVSKSHVVAGCENAQGAGDAAMFFWDVKMI